MIISPNNIVLERKIVIILCCIISAFPVLPYGVRSVIMILIVFFGILFYFLNKKQKKKPSINKFQRSYLILNSILFALLLLSLIYTQDYVEGIGKLIKLLPLLVFTVVFFLQREVFTDKNIKYMLYLFTLSVCLLVLYQIFLAFLNLDYLMSPPSYQELKNNGLVREPNIHSDFINKIKTRRFRQFMAATIDTHPTYLGMWITLALFVLFNLIKKSSLGFKIILILGCCVLLIWMLLIASRMPIAALFLGLLVTQLFFLKSVKLKISYFIFAFSFFLISLVLVDSFRVRVQEVFESSSSLPEKDWKVDKYNSTSVRKGIYYCSFIIIKENLIFGVGIGDVKQALDTCYDSEIGAKIYQWQHYNSHNQYLFYLLSGGLICFVIFLLILKVSVVSALKNGNPVYLFFLCVTIIIFLTENILVRSDGIMYFSFFNAIFMYNTGNKNNV